MPLTQTQTAPLGATTSLKGNNQSITLYSSILFLFVVVVLRFVSFRYFVLFLFCLRHSNAERRGNSEQGNNQTNNLTNKQQNIIFQTNKLFLAPCSSSI